MKNLSESFEDYLELIYCYELKGMSDVHSNTLAKDLNVTKAAITKAMAKLVAEGYILKEAYGTITLTDKGRNTAKVVLDKHQSIREFLMNIGVSKENAEIDCCKIEHIICDETFSKIKEFNKKIKNK